MEEIKISSSPVPYTFQLSFGFQKEHMEILKQVLEVDKELNHKIVNRSLEITDDQFLLKYESLDPKKLRSAITNMIENMVLVLRTIEEFH